MIVFTQHCLERFIKRAKIKNVEEALNKLQELAENVRPINKRFFIHNDECLIVDNEGIIQTYYKLNKKKLGKLNNERNLKILDKILKRA